MLSIKPDHWIRRMAQEHGMIEPFVERQVRGGVVSYGLSSYGYDIRVADEFRIFTPATGQLTVIDPKQMDERAMAPYQGEVCIVPPNSFALARTIEYFRIPRNVLTICLGKSTYARCGIIVNVTPFEPEWEGHVTIEISNTTPLPAKIYANEGIAQVLFFEGEPPEVSYADRAGKYQGSAALRCRGCDWTPAASSGTLALMFELVFLGTSASAPSVQRGLSSALVMANEHRFMIDCGEGTQRQLLRSGLGFRRLDKILLTHGHLDHILGLGGLASTLGRWEALEELNIYGGTAALTRVHALMEVVFGAGRIPQAGVALNVIEPGLLFEDRTFTLTVVPVQHRGPDCLGFVFEEKSRRPFLPEAAEALGIPHGPVRRDLAIGLPVTLPDGRTIDPDTVLGAAQRGAKLCFIGDVSHTGPLHDIAAGANLLAIEATYLDADRELAKQHGHITATAAARLARNAGVEHLVLHHVSRRYPSQEILAEAQAIFPNTALASDLDLFSVFKDKPVTMRSLRHRQ